MKLLAALPFVLFTAINTNAQAINNGMVDQKYSFDIQTISDSTGIPDQYKVYIKTPICEDANCYVVEINFYFDLIGRYIKFDTIDGKGLTRLDHIPFTAGDYQKLDQLLNDPSSPIGNYKMDELVKDTRKSEIDGLTGATIEEVKEVVIPGGVYSCHTLWHIVHGDLKTHLQQKTASLLDKPLVNKLTNKKDQDINYFLITSFSEDQFTEFLPQVLITFEQSDGYYLKHAIEEMPEIVINDSLAQNYFAHKFQKLNYFYQVALLKKLNSHALIAPLKEALEKSLDERNSIKNELIMNLINEQDHK